MLRNIKNATRITLRFIYISEGLEEPTGIFRQARTSIGTNVKYGYETEIPLRGEWKDYSIIYYGENNIERFSPPEILKAEDALIEQVFRNRKSYDPLEKVRKLGYRIETGSLKRNDIDQIYQVYRDAFTRYLFEITPETVRNLLDNEDVRVAVARDLNDQIVAIIVGEIAEIRTDLGNLKICELSDEATLKPHRGMGLNQACVKALIEELNNSGIDLIYQEDRACHIAVNQQSANLGFMYAGRLNKHCVIGGDREIQEEGPYENLNVVYLPGWFNERIKRNFRK